MFSIPSLYELGTCSDSYDILHGMFNTLPSSSDDVENQNLSPRSMAEAKAVAASNSHKEAERRRRKRINGHISTLKSILPNTTKTDKASLLSEAVRRVKELKKTALELEKNDQSNNTLKLMLPSETDELKLNRCDDNSGLIKATLCCEDRPEMIIDLIQALDSVQAKVVRAEMSTLGGRTKSVLWVKINSNNNDYKNNNNDSNVEGESDMCLGTLRRALKTVVDKSTFLAGNNQCLPGNKRQRYYHLC